MINASHLPRINWGASAATTLSAELTACADHLTAVAPRLTEAVASTVKSLKALPRAGRSRPAARQVQ